MKAKIVFKGGPGSGNYAHAGRPGKVGGSLPRGIHGTTAALSRLLNSKRYKDMEAVALPIINKLAAEKFGDDTAYDSLYDFARDERLHNLSKNDMYRQGVKAYMEQEADIIGKPTIATKDEIDKLVYGPDATHYEAYRGIATNGSVDGVQAVEQYKSGDYYYGKGVYGDGAYFAYNAADSPTPQDSRYALQTAEGYARKDGGIIRAAIPKTARFITDEEMYYAKRDLFATNVVDNAMQSLWNKSKTSSNPQAYTDAMVRMHANNTASGQSEFNNILKSDNGYLAHLMGYDAILVENAQFMVSLNRGVVVAQDVQNNTYSW